ncbi:MAG: lysophospholipid acyltransferase family protein [Actinomycetes bacterium]
MSPDLPHTAHLPASREWSLRLARGLARGIVRSWWQAQVSGREHVPRQGPVILAANHIGILDGPLLVASTSRLTFAMAKQELFSHRFGWLLAHFGQIPVDRRSVDTTAVSRSVQVLRADKVLAVFPEGARTGGEVAWARGGAAYLAMVTGAPIVPVALLGTRQPGQTRSQLPPRGAPLHVVYGPAFRLPRADWPRRQAQVRELTEEVRRRLADHVRWAQAQTGLPLPGPPRRPEAAPRPSHPPRLTPERTPG